MNTQIIRIWVHIHFQTIYNISFLFHRPSKMIGALAIEAVLFLLRRLYSLSDPTHFFLIKNISRNIIDLNDHLNLWILYIEFRRYLLRLDLNMLTKNLANVGTQFTPRDIIFNTKFPTRLLHQFWEFCIENYISRCELCTYICQILS